MIAVELAMPRGTATRRLASQSLAVTGRTFLMIRWPQYRFHTLFFYAAAPPLELGSCPR